MSLFRSTSDWDAGWTPFSASLLLWFHTAITHMTAAEDKPVIFTTVSPEILTGSFLSLIRFVHTFVFFKHLFLILRVYIFFASTPQFLGHTVLDFPKLSVLIQTAVIFCWRCSALSWDAFKGLFCLVTLDWRHFDASSGDHVRLWRRTILGPWSKFRGSLFEEHRLHPQVKACSDLY